jgi:hypothetical protein
MNPISIYSKANIAIFSHTFLVMAFNILRLEWLSIVVAVTLVFTLSLSISLIFNTSKRISARLAVKHNRMTLIGNLLQSAIAFTSKQVVRKILIKRLAIMGFANLANFVLAGETIIIIVVCVLLDGCAMLTAGKSLVKEISANAEQSTTI